MSPSRRRVRGISSVAKTTGSAPELRPRARRSPPPPHARDREQVTPQPGQPAQRSQDSLSITRASGVRATPIRWKPSKPTNRSHRSQRPSDTEQQQVGRDTAQGPLKTAGLEVHSTSRTTTPTPNPRPTPGHPHSTRKSPKSVIPTVAIRGSCLEDPSRQHAPAHTTHTNGSPLTRGL